VTLIPACRGDNIQGTPYPAGLSQIFVWVGILDHDLKACFCLNWCLLKRRRKHRESSLSRSRALGVTMSFTLGKSKEISNQATPTIEDNGGTFILYQSSLCFAYEARCSLPVPHNVVRAELLPSGKTPTKNQKRHRYGERQKVRTDSTANKMCYAHSKHDHLKCGCNPHWTDVMRKDSIGKGGGKKRKEQGETFAINYRSLLLWYNTISSFHPHININICPWSPFLLKEMPISFSDRYLLCVLLLWRIFFFREHRF